MVLLPVFEFLNSNPTFAEVLVEPFTQEDDSQGPRLIHKQRMIMGVTHDWLTPPLVPQMRNMLVFSPPFDILCGTIF